MRSHADEDALLDGVIAGIREWAQLGYEREGDVECFGRVEERGPLARLHILYPPLTADLRQRGEASLDRPLPDPYLAWLWRSNGLRIFSGTLSLSGVRGEPTESRRASDLLIPNVLERIPDASEFAFFFGFYEWDGSQLYLDEDGKVHRCSRDSAEPLNTWPSFAEALSSEFHRLSALADERGRIDEDVPTVP